MPANLLYVWLRGELCAQLEQLRTGKLRLRFDPNFVAAHGLGTPSLSLSVPNTLKRLEGPHLERFFDNLLPENPLRATLERQYGVRPNDTFGLLRCIGLDCAGAVQFTESAQSNLEGFHRELSAAELTHLVLTTPTIDTPDDLPLSASLGGVQPKLLLWREGDRWFWPAAGAPSNVIAKPNPSNTPISGLLELEHWALDLARSVGIPAARTTLETFGDRQVLLVDRFDRLDQLDGPATADKQDRTPANHPATLRVHQEDFAQALSIPVAAKYEPASTSEHTRFQELVSKALPFANTDFIPSLIRQITFNAVVGNGDAHSKNYSLTLTAEGEVELAPLYDVAPVFLANSNFRGFGHVVAQQSSLRHINGRHIRDEAASWGYSPTSASEIVGEVCEQLISALPGDISEPAHLVTESGAGYADAVRIRAEAFATSLG